MNTIRVLQLGENNWGEIYTFPEMVDFIHETELTEIPRRPFDVVFVDRPLEEGEQFLMHKMTKAYTLFVPDDVPVNQNLQWLMKYKKGKVLSRGEIQNFLFHELRYYFPDSYGDKQKPGSVAIAQGFKGKVKWNGQYSVELEGDFGDEFSQAVFWRNNLLLQQGQAQDIWLEYKKSENVSIQIEVTQFELGSISKEVAKWVFDEKQLEDQMELESAFGSGLLFVSLHAKGTGNLQIIALHSRFSRRGHGMFIPGGQRVVTSQREEVFYYFDPGNLKPPLNIYFSGYKTREGFEGYNMMCGFGAPFLLVAEARLEGGGFYMGSREYEKAIVDIIRSCLDELQFTPDQVIMSGLSMGTFGALYYACDIKPHALIIGKPLASLGNMAYNEKRNRPKGFPTSLDVLRCQTGGTGGADVTTLNQKFWDKFDKTDWGETKFIVAYMIEDDYDGTAYYNLISHINTPGTQLYGKGLHGRHNDDTNGIVTWFITQYHKVLEEDFGRKRDKT